MLYTLSSRFINLIYKDTASPSDKSILIYATEILVSSLITTLAVFFVGVLLDDWVGSLLFITIFVVLRSHCGGYHSETFSGCFSISILLFTLIELLCKYITISLIHLFTIGALGLLLIVWLAPIENHHKQLSIEKKKRNKLMSIALFIILMIACFLMFVTHCEYLNVVYFSICVILAMMPIGMAKEHYIRRKSS